MRRLVFTLLLLYAADARAVVDKACQSACGVKGFTESFCEKVCTYDPEKGTAPAFNVQITPEPPAPAAPPVAAAPPKSNKPPPPTAKLVPFNPIEDDLRAEVRRLKAENAALQRELERLRGRTTSPR
jgi:hypothetical protein